MAPWVYNNWEDHSPKETWTNQISVCYKQEFTITKFVISEFDKFLNYLHGFQQSDNWGKKEKFLLDKKELIIGEIWKHNKFFNLCLLAFFRAIDISLTGRLFPALANARMRKSVSKTKIALLIFFLQKQMIGGVELLTRSVVNN